jgi:hypothetical protein
MVRLPTSGGRVSYRVFVSDLNEGRSTKLPSATIYKVAWIVAIAASICLSSGAWAAEEQGKMSAFDLVQMIGVNTHMTYTDGAYANSENVRRDLEFLGIHHIRDVLPGSENQAALLARDALKRMIFNKIKLNLFCLSGWTSASIAWLRTLEGAVPGSIASIEGYNEIDNFPIKYDGQTGPAAAEAGQRALYGAIKSDPDLMHIPVIDLTGRSAIVKESGFTSLSGDADVMNVHAYSQNGTQPRNSINSEKPGEYKSVTAAMPKTITEFGYSSRPGSGSGFIGVDEKTQAKGVLNGLFDAARLGYQKIYLYELLDQKPDPEMKELELHFGLFSFENRPKPAAYAIRNLTTVLAETNSGSKEAAGSTAPDDAPIQIKANEADAEDPLYSLILKKDNGARVVAIWREPAFWDQAAGRPLEAPPVRANVSFGKACSSIKLYDVLQSSDPISTSAGESLSLLIGDHVQLVECTV